MSIMKSMFKNPYKVTHKIYSIIILISLISLIVSLSIQTGECKFIILLFDIIKNLSYGSIASTIVAWLIDCANVRILNKKAQDSYEMIYGDLKFKIAFYIGIWAELCLVAYKDTDYHKEKKTWKEWYLTVKQNFETSEEKRQNELMPFFYDQLKYNVDKVNESLEKIDNQKYLLTINDLNNLEINRVIDDFKFEFHALELELSHKENYEYFWTSMDAITDDIERYIDNWEDISYYNVLKFEPYHFTLDKKEIYKAILLKAGHDENAINMALDKIEI